MKILYGKKTVLFPFDPKVDFKHFVEVHRKDKQGYMCRFCLRDLPEDIAYQYISDMILRRQVFIWTVMSQGKDARRVGFIYLSDVSTFSASVSGIMDSEFAKSLDKQMRRGKVTFAEEALTLMIDACFKDFNLLRIDSDLTDHNRAAMALNRRIGFVKEGVRRKAYKVDNQYHDIIMMSILKEEWKNHGQEQRAIHTDSAVSSAG